MRTKQLDTVNYGKRPCYDPVIGDLVKPETGAMAILGQAACRSWSWGW
jgi:hypothetical protein